MFREDSPGDGRASLVHFEHGEAEPGALAHETLYRNLSNGEALRPQPQCESRLLGRKGLTRLKNLIGLKGRKGRKGPIGLTNLKGQTAAAV